MEDGIISYNDFERGAYWLEQNCELKQESATWTWMKPDSGVPDSGYLAFEGWIKAGRRNTHNEDLNASRPNECTAQMSRNEPNDDSDDELAVGSGQSVGNKEGHIYDFHILYSASYQVPVLWFCGRVMDGSPLSLDDIFEDFPKLLEAAKSMHGEQQAVSADLHPVHQMPWYFLHPCQTPDLMQLLQKNTDPKSDEIGSHPRKEEGMCIEGAEQGPSKDEHKDVEEPGIENKDAGLYLMGWCSLVFPVFRLNRPKEKLCSSSR